MFFDNQMTLDALTFSGLVVSQVFKSYTQLWIWPQWTTLNVAPLILTECDQLQLQLHCVHASRDSVASMANELSYRLHNRWVFFSAEFKDFCLLKLSRPALEPTQSLTQWVQRLKRPTPEADDSPSSKDEVKNEWGYRPNYTPTYAFRAYTGTNFALRYVSKHLLFLTKTWNLTRSVYFLVPLA